MSHSFTAILRNAQGHSYRKCLSCFVEYYGDDNPECPVNDAPWIKAKREKKLKAFAFLAKAIIDKGLDIKLSRNVGCHNSCCSQKDGYCIEVGDDMAAFDDDLEDLLIDNLEWRCK